MTVKTSIALIFCLVGVVALGSTFFLQNIDDIESDHVALTSTDELHAATTSEDKFSPSSVNVTVDEEEIESLTFDFLTMFYKLYYVTQNDGETGNDETTSGLMMSLLTRTMKDKNSLENILPTVERYLTHKNETVSITATAIQTTVMHLVANHASLIKYLRSENVVDPNLSEFQYQFATFDTENKDAFNTLIEGTALFPYVFIEFGENESQSNSSRLSTSTKDRILSEIERLYSEPFIQDDKWRAETGNSNAVLFIIRNYRDFLLKM
jgi:hypothetical protein